MDEIKLEKLLEDIKPRILEDIIDSHKNKIQVIRYDNPSSLYKTIYDIGGDVKNGYATLPNYLVTTLIKKIALQKIN